MIRYLLLIVMLVFGAVPQAYAASGDEARQFVDGVGKKILSTLNSSQPDSQKQQQLRQMFAENVDMEWMGKFVLGPAWQQASEDQRSRYLTTYKEYLLARYTKNFTDYTDSNYTITGVKSESDGQFTVGMTVKSPHAQEQETRAGYRVHAPNGSYKIIDIIIEGVSLITTERSEFGAVVQKDGLDKLIEQLKTKA